jgi:hypothetical protein
MKRFYWNEDTLDYFSDLAKESEDKFLKKAESFVRYECDLEDGETYEDLLVDLINQVYETTN